MKQSACSAVICQPGGDELKHDIGNKNLIMSTDPPQPCAIPCHSTEFHPSQDPIAVLKNSYWNISK